MYKLFGALQAGVTKNDSGFFYKHNTIDISDAFAKIFKPAKIASAGRHTALT